MILLVLMSLLLTAAFFYLPNHIFLISNRVWYYLGGELRNTSASTNNNLSGISSLVDKISVSTATQAARSVAQTIDRVTKHVDEL
jgi:hypothetical protein